MPTSYCRHMMTNGRRCGSPRMKGGPYCFFHRDLFRRHSRRRPDTILHPTQHDGQRDPQTIQQFAPLELPPLEDHQSIQVALSMLIGALAAQRIDRRHASTLFYGLQVASRNMIPRMFNNIEAEDAVRETTLDHEGHHLAPDEDPPSVQAVRRRQATL